MWTLYTRWQHIRLLFTLIQQAWLLWRIAGYQRREDYYRNRYRDYPEGDNTSPPYGDEVDGSKVK